MSEFFNINYYWEQNINNVTSELKHDMNYRDKQIESIQIEEINKTQKNSAKSNASETCEDIFKYSDVDTAPHSSKNQNQYNELPLDFKASDDINVLYLDDKTITNIAKTIPFENEDLFYSPDIETSSQHSTKNYNINNYSQDSPSDFKINDDLNKLDLVNKPNEYMNLEVKLNTDYYCNIKTADSSKYDIFSSVNDPYLPSMIFEYNKNIWDIPAIKDVIFIITKEPRNILKSENIQNSNNISNIDKFSIKKEKKSKSARYDEPFKNIKSRAFGKHFKILKDLEKSNPNITEIEILFKYMRELFVVDAKKDNNLKRLNFSFLDILVQTKEDLINNINNLHIRICSENSKQSRDYEKIRNLTKELYVMNNDLKKILNLNFTDLKSSFRNQESKIILRKRFIEIIDEFSISEDAKVYRNILITKKNKSKEYIINYDSILKNFVKYLGPQKIDFSFIERKKKIKKR